MKNKQHLPISGHIFALRENKKCFSVSFVCCNWIVLELIVVVNFCLVWCFNFISRFHPRDSMHRIYWTGLFTLRAWKRSFMLVEKQLFLGVEKNNRSSNASCIFIIIFFLLAKNNKIDTSSFKMFFFTSKLRLSSSILHEGNIFHNILNIAAARIFIIYQIWKHYLGFFFLNQIMQHSILKIGILF